MKTQGKNGPFKGPRIPLKTSTRPPKGLNVTNKSK